MSAYLSHALAQIPRLLSRMDREAPSKTYGAFDRTFWGWKFTDFHGARFQEALYPLAWLYTTQIPGNPYYQDARIREWIRAGFQYWQTLQHADGSFDEAYPYERSLAAVSFTGFYLGEAFLRMGADFPADIQQSVQKTLERAGDWLCRNDAHPGVLSNHLAAPAAALDVIARITNGPIYADRAKHFINRILSRQSDEGLPEKSGTRLRPSCAGGGAVCPSSENVAQRSMFSVTASMMAPGVTAGPATIKGTWMSVSNAVCFPARSECSPMWNPLSLLKTK